jgi:hypothetical protein
MPEGVEKATGMTILNSFRFRKNYQRQVPYVSLVIDFHAMTE